ncbi:MAG: DUF86 domain-containing protein [Euryarchaeota archaeon]|nr:DUF86 domain-containing protein [Euryarchaeota archaeon]
MSKRDLRFFITDMLEAIEKIQRYTAGQTLEGFAENDILVDAVVRNLEVIGEAAKYIPAEWRKRYPAIDWRRVVGFRNIVIHTYFAVDVGAVWTIATRQLDELKQVLTQMLQEINEG